MGVGRSKDWQYWLMIFVILASFLLLITASMDLMVVKSDYYKNLARDNKVRELRVPAGRAEIYDRKGRVIAKSIYAYFHLVEGSKVFDKIGGFDGLRFEGKDLAYELKRKYSYGESLSTVSGYLGELRADELKDWKQRNCHKGISNKSLVGRGGVEEYFDCQLRGIDGKRLVEVDAKGDYVRELGRVDPQRGEDVHLSLDAYWQKKIYGLLKGRKAVVVMSQPKDGKIIALVSSPAFDPNLFSFEKDNKKIKELLNDKENLPMLNRVVLARYQPGSVFKMVVATAGLEMGKINGNSLIEDTGVIRIGDYSYSNWLWNKRGQTDGQVDVVKAIKRSNDIFFYRLGERVGVDGIKSWAKKFGLEDKTGVELKGELKGIVPDEKWKLEQEGEKWYLGNTFHLAIGQGGLSVTPLEINRMTNVIASGGKKCQMTLLKDKKKDCQDLGIKKENLDLVVKGMKGACHKGGTAWPLFNFKTELACKTGTAQVGDGSGDSQAWLTAFAPADDPEISITVLVERGGEGSDEAAPIAGDILKDWFDEPETKVPRYGEGKKVVYE
ncbi:hypothetical protein DRH14_00450 [Candidatus Shapirobacteria bacterium]|nr:MAG: hypothetical protein DRH14_00450 [Candidatus Shapirobacteria bacterium]